MRLIISKIVCLILGHAAPPHVAMARSDGRESKSLEVSYCPPLSGFPDRRTHFWYEPCRRCRAIYLYEYREEPADIQPPLEAVVGKSGEVLGYVRS